MNITGKTVKAGGLPEKSQKNGRSKMGGGERPTGCSVTFVGGGEGGGGKTAALGFVGGEVQSLNTSLGRSETIDKICNLKQKRENGTRAT